MALFDAILVPGTARGTRIAGLATVTSSAEQEVGPNQIFAVTASDDFNIRFGVAGMGAADATDFRIGAEQIVTFDTGSAFTHFRVFNPTGAAIDVHYLRLSRV